MHVQQRDSNMARPIIVWTNCQVESPWIVGGSWIMKRWAGTNSSDAVVDLDGENLLNLSWEKMDDGWRWSSEGEDKAISWFRMQCLLLKMSLMRWKHAISLTQRSLFRLTEIYTSWRWYSDYTGVGKLGEGYIGVVKLMSDTNGGRMNLDDSERNESERVLYYFLGCLAWISYMVILWTTVSLQYISVNCGENESENQWIEQKLVSKLVILQMKMI